MLPKHGVLCVVFHKSRLARRYTIGYNNTCSFKPIHRKEAQMPEWLKNFLEFLFKWQPERCMPGAETPWCGLDPIQFITWFVIIAIVIYIAVAVWSYTFKKEKSKE